MSNIKKYENFVNEEYTGIGAAQFGLNLSAAFGYSDISTVNGGNGAEQPVDTQTSFDAYDRHKNNLKDQINRYLQISKNIFANGTYNLGYDFISEIENLHIAKIFSNNNGLLDIFVRFTLQENVYYGKFEDWGGINKAVFKSKVLMLPIINGFKDNSVRLIGLLEETLNKWFTPQEDAIYTALTEVRVYDSLGKDFEIPKGGKVKVEDVILQDFKSLVYLTYSGKTYTFSGIEYYYFNWWFEIQEKNEYYL